MSQDVVAVVGMAGVFPAGPDLEAFRRVVWDGICCSRKADAQRWFPDLPGMNPDDLFDARKPFPDSVYSTKACFVEDAWLDLDPASHRLPAATVAALDPMFKLGLKAAVRAYGDANMAAVDPKRVSVVIGNIALPTQTTSQLSRDWLGDVFGEVLTGGRFKAKGSDVAPLNRYVAGLPAGLMAAALGLGGGAYTMDAACASSLYAVGAAVEDLLAHRVDAVLSGGLSRPDSLYTQMGFAQLRALSASGTPSPFGADADGLVVGEGSGIFVLKRLSDALKQGDRVYGLIHAVGLSNDIDGSLLAPDSEGQVRAMEAAYRRTGWSPWDVDLFECHATGTLLGDKVEYNSLKYLWRDAPIGDQKAVIGSVKSNVGHLLTAAGSAAMAKVLLAFREKSLPPTAGFQQPSPHIDLEQGPFRVLQKAESWRQPKHGARKAAVSAFGFGGINAHVLMEAWDDHVSPAVPAPRVKPEAIAVVGYDAGFAAAAEKEILIENMLYGNPREAEAAGDTWWGIERCEILAEGRRVRPKAFDYRTLKVPLGKFRIPPNELKEMLPQQLLMLTVAARAMADAGLEPERRAKAGVFIGIALDLNTTNFQNRWVMRERARCWASDLGFSLDENQLDQWTASLREAFGPALNANRTMGALGGIVASRIARELRFGGAGYTVSSEENSGFHALLRGVRGLQTGELDLALIGGVDFAADPRAVLATQACEQGFGPRGLTGSLDDLVGEGAAAMVLKRLSDAERDGDHIYAVVDGIGQACNGRPEDGFAAALAAAELEKSQVTGPVDLLVAEGFQPEDIADLLPGAEVQDTTSVVGFTGAASFSAAMYRALVALDYEILPADQNGKARFWLHNRGQGPRTAAVAVASVDGNVSTALLRKPERETEPKIVPDTTEPILMLFDDQAKDHIATLLAGIEAGTDVRELAGRQESRRSKKDVSFAYLAEDREQLRQDLAVLHDSLDNPRWRDQEDIRRMEAQNRLFLSKERFSAGEVAFVFPGSGSHFHTMGRALARRFPGVFKAQHRESSYLKDQMRPDLFWATHENDALHDDHNALLSAQVALGVIMSDLVREFGIDARAYIGYSLGETASLFASRTWTERDVMHVRMRDTDLFTEHLAGPCRSVAEKWGVEAPVAWTLGVVNRGEDEVRPALEKYPHAYLLIVNTPDECVVGGDPNAVKSLVKSLGCRYFELRGVTTVHCEVAEPVAEAYRNLHLLKTTPPADTKFYRGMDGQAYQPDTEACADSILGQALHGVHFPKTIRSAYQDGARVFIEMGPGNSCTRMTRKILGDAPHLAVAVCPRTQKPITHLLRVLARLAVAGIPLTLDPLFTAPEIETQTPVKGYVEVPVGGPRFQALPQPPTAKPRPQAENLETPSVPPPEAPAPAKHQAAVANMTAPPAKNSNSAASNTTTPQQSSSRNHGDLPMSHAAQQPNPTPQQPATGDALSAHAAAHQAFLRLRRRGEQLTANLIQYQMDLITALGNGDLPVDVAAPTTTYSGQAQVPVSTAHSSQKRKPLRDVPTFMDREACVQFAVGKIGDVLGEAYREIDQYPTRVRLPDEPLMLVDRILEVEGEPMSHGRVVTEHDVMPDSWYLDCNRIPTCIAVEAGQADLFLSGYLGIDKQTKGKSVYRLLDAVVTFHDELPRPGQIIHYDIKIERFFRQGNPWFFHFSFEGTVDGKPLLTMRDGCAGFFTEEELAAGKGIVQPRTKKREESKLDPHFKPFTQLARESFDDRQIAALRAGDLVTAFGEQFTGLNLERPVTLPDGKMRLLDRVTNLDPEGGRFGLGFIRAEFDIHPDDWFLTCHFVDDMVMPGTLMYECCLHTLRVYLLRMGWLGETGKVAYQPVPGVASRLKCRGQVLVDTKKACYEVTVKEIGYRPEPYVIVDALMFSDDKAIVEITDMSLRISGLDRQTLETLWAGKTSATPSLTESETFIKPAVYSRDKILAYAIGKPSEAFGEPYKIFDQDRIIARLPGPPFMFVDRVVAVKGEPWKMVAGGKVETQYDIPEEAWYFSANRQNTMPFVVLLEAALQPCGWMAAYIGSALTADIDLSFRNLGGEAVWHRAVTPKSGTIAVDVDVSSVSSSGGMVIQHYAMKVRDQQGLVYEGTTYFGFFSKAALANQVGIREAVPYEPNPEEAARAQQFPYPAEAPFPEPHLRMVDEITCYLPDGGSKGLGFIRGTKRPHQDDWYFKAHFYQDPVVPGSLGLESFLQLLKVFAVKRWNLGEDAQFQTPALGEKHKWVYRGQVVPRDALVTVQAEIVEIDDQRKLIRAQGHLMVDGRIIYGMEQFTLALA